MNLILDNSKKLKQLVFTTEYIDDVTKKINNGYIIPGRENPWLDGKEIGVLRSKLAFTRTDEENIEYLKCYLGEAEDGSPFLDPNTQKLKMKGIHYFVNKFAQTKREDGSQGNISLRDYQYDVLDLFNENRFSILLASRQVGKTIMSSLFILWYCIFNNDKNIMVIANKGATVVEILDKIKSIYKLLPVWLKPGVDVWNTKSIVFGDTNCRILTSARSKEPAIGFTIDVLYLDEFAHIPRNIIEPYYRAAFPTVANIKNSKIIITSTPNGKNLFWKLYTGATEEENHPYKSMRIPWDRVKGRHVTYLRLDTNIFNEFNINKEQILNEIKKIEKTSFLEWSNELNKFVIHIPNSIELTPDDIRRKSIEINNTEYKLIELGEIMSWRELEIKAIGSVEAFNQEYGLQFMAGNKRLLEPEIISNIEENLEEFEYLPLEGLSDRPFSKCVPNFTDLKFTKNIELFNILKRKEYRMWISIDLAEGLKKDYTVINIFRQIPLSLEEAKIKKIDDISKAFRLVQVGIWRSNLYSISEISEILYCIVFNLLNPEYTKIVMEMNKNFGNMVLSTMPNLYRGENDFGTYPFLRYKHNLNDEKTKIGLIVSGGEGINSMNSRPIMIRDYVDRISRNEIIVKEKDTINEVVGFVKDTLPSGKQIWVSDSGNDDIVATVINICTIFDKMEWKASCEELIEQNIQLNQLIWGNSQISDNGMAGAFDGITRALGKNRY